MNEEKVMQAALENSMRLFPPCVHNFKLQKEVNFLSEGFSKEEIMFTSPFTNKKQLLLSTFGTVNGAVALFYPGVIEKMMKVMEGPFLAVFMNINDVMIFERTDIASGRQFAGTAKSGSKLGEMLSGKLYLCDEKGIHVKD